MERINRRLKHSKGYKGIIVSRAGYSGWHGQLM